MQAYKVFPATLNSEGQKVPLIKGWKDLASSDPEQIRLWQELFKGSLSFWGIPCGAANGIYVLDIDVKKINGFKSLQDLGYQIPNTLCQKTPSGGAHFFFKAHQGFHYNNTVNSDLGLDTRGDGGWVAFYGFANDAPTAECPEWLFKLRPPKSVQEAQGTPIAVAPEIAQQVIQTALEAIRQAPEGESNNVLNTQAFKVGQLVASGSVSREYAEAALYRAARERGKPDFESRATIASGLDGGTKKNLTSPFGEQPPTPSFAIPELPGPPERWTPKYASRYDLMNVSMLRKPQLFQDWSTEDIHITVADGGTGKTTLKLYEAVCLALGERFLGFDCRQSGKTLFITGEDTDKKLYAIIGKILRQMGLCDEDGVSDQVKLENNLKIEIVLKSVIIKKDSDLCLIQKDRMTGFLSPNSDALRKVLEAVHDIQPKMIVLDPISSFWGSESALNDMNKAVIKFVSEIVDRSNACVEMINHSGKQSSQSKDDTQFAGRGGTGLPSNARVSRHLRGILDDEYFDMTGEHLGSDQAAMVCTVNKFTDGSPHYRKPFIILRDGYLFSRKVLTAAKARDMEKSLTDIERIFKFIKEQREMVKYPTKNIVIGHFMLAPDPISEKRVKVALDQLRYGGVMQEFVKEIENPDLTVRDKVFIIADESGREI